MAMKWDLVITLIIILAIGSMFSNIILSIITALLAYYAIAVCLGAIALFIYFMIRS